MIVCYSPVLIYMMLLFVSRKHASDTWVLAETIAYLNSSINPFVFCWRLSELRAAVLKTLRKIYSIR